jgi:hypothetical protein
MRQLGHIMKKGGFNYKPLENKKNSQGSQGTFVCVQFKDFRAL